jgi:hypothetical protein
MWYVARDWRVESIVAENPPWISVFYIYFIFCLGLPLLRSVACVGGTAMKDQLETIKK